MTPNTQRLIDTLEVVSTPPVPRALKEWLSSPHDVTVATHELSPCKIELSTPIGLRQKTLRQDSVKAAWEALIAAGLVAQPKMLTWKFNNPWGHTDVQDHPRSFVELVRFALHGAQAHATAELLTLKLTQALQRFWGTSDGPVTGVIWTYSRSAHRYYGSHGNFHSRDRLFSDQPDVVYASQRLWDLGLDVEWSVNLQMDRLQNHRYRGNSRPIIHYCMPPSTSEGYVHPPLYRPREQPL